MGPTRSVRFAVVGCGNIGARHLAILAKHPNAEITAICDKVADKCAEFSRRYAGVRAYTDYDRLLGSEQPDVVVICTPHWLHAPMAIAAAEARRHVLVEKPLALTSADAQATVEAGRRHGVRVMVVKQNRHNEPVVALNNAIRDGRLGKVLMAQCSVIWQRPESYYTDSDWRGRLGTEGGALWTQVSHFIDLLIWWCGDVTRATAHLARRRHPIEIEDCGTAELSFAGGAIGTLFWTTCGRNRNTEGSLTLVGEKGTVKIGGSYLNRLDYWELADGAPPPETVESAAPNQYKGYQGSSSQHPRVIDEVIQEVRSGASAIVDAQEGVRTVKAIEMIYANATWEPGA